MRRTVIVMIAEDTVPPVIAPLVRLDKRFDSGCRVFFRQIQRALIDQQRQAAVRKRPIVLEQMRDYSRFFYFYRHGGLFHISSLCSEDDGGGTQCPGRQKKSSVHIHNAPVLENLMWCE